MSQNTEGLSFHPEKQVSFPELTTERLILRKFRPDDIEWVYQGLSHRDVIRYYGVSYDSLEAAKEQMDWFVSIEKEEKGIWWAVCCKNRHIFLGGIGFNNWDKENRKTEMGYLLLPEHWGSGIIKEAGLAACEYAFQIMSVHRIEAMVETENLNSKKIMYKLNFELEGVMRDCEIKGGKFVSLEMYAKLSDVGIYDG